MSRQLSIINSANIFSLNFLKHIRGYDKVKLGDIYNSRKHFLFSLNKHKAENKDISFSHHNINADLLLSNAIKGSDTVLYFSNDYFSKVEDKNEQLLKAAKIAKENNVSKFIAVTPIEYVNYQTGSIVEDPIKDLNETNKKVLDINNKATIVKSDLIFGSDTYFVKFLMQSWAQSYTYFDNNDNLKHYKFNPM